MIYEIMSRLEASQATKIENAPDTAIISITDVGKEKNNFKQVDWLKHIFEIQFDDVEAGKKNCITVSQAVDIADFVFHIKKDVERIIVHCEFGQSRSAGVAAAIRCYIEGNDGGILHNRRYNINRTCYRYVLKALRKRGRILTRIIYKLR
ncbi:MAG: hypothetical protein LBI03_06460 [Clostridiales bacterium]|jgi:predicted protein tyrosine phosphatase|nr:hypothetical protein [Clostridiales bacterium]